ncbi:hypothetical protein MK786_06740 [Microbacterium sp. CFH 31415]|uniref:hypothetical protein n=1 Tax=Microbacterium sp. CFH 31415 TaxID=2921732 RepID=UPI001F132FF5|nr:hypothetical protein [Microbacterium sp. CFH 31415]MCH6230431.1 hypothetical protein [Microbacterium sp. CFH 31415]
MRLRTRPHVRATNIAVAALLAVPLTGCAPSFFTDGDDLAHRGAENIAAEIGSHSDNTGEVSLEEMVSWWVPEEVEALDWSGQIGHDSEATIDVRIHVEVAAYTSPNIGGRSNSAGEATVCYRLVWPRYYEARRSEISCPDTVAPPRPLPRARPELTEHDTARVAEILSAKSELDTLESALHDAFPDDYIRIDIAFWNGETVVAVGIPAERECILVVRDEAGELFYPSYRPISLEPGETGCATDLYTNPPR